MPKRAAALEATAVVVVILPVAVVALLPVAVATAAVVKGVGVPPLRHPQMTVEVVEEVTSLQHPRAEVAIFPAVEAGVAESTIPSAVEAMAAVPLLQHPRATGVAESTMLLVEAAVEAPPLWHPRATMEAAVIPSAVEATLEAPLLQHPQMTVEVVEEVTSLQHPRAEVAIFPAVKSAVASTMLSVAVKRVAAMSLLRRPRAMVVAPPLRHPRASPQASQAAVEAPPLWHPRAMVVTR
jgi:hypothetical protein